MGIQHLCVLWMVILSGHVCAALKLLRSHVGESVVIPCSGPPDLHTAAYAVNLKRCWVQESDVLFMYTNSSPHLKGPYATRRITVSGDPSTWTVNFTISDLAASDTDRYCCEFFVEAQPDDQKVPGQTEFFIYVPNDDPSMAAVVHVETCAGGSASLPCTRPPGADHRAAVEGFSLKRKKTLGPVEVLYHSQYHHRHHLASADGLLPSSSSSSSSASSSSSSPFPADRLSLTTAPAAAGGLAFNLTLKGLRPQESGFYSCTLLLAGRPNASGSLGSGVLYVSVQGGQCDQCTSYAVLLYSLSAAVPLMLLLVVLLACRGRGRSRVKPQAQAPIYEEMGVAKQPKPKQGPCGSRPFHLEEAEVSEYSNSLVAKPRAENHYESPLLARVGQS